jgi:transposase-like protein
MDRKIPSEARVVEEIRNVLRARMKIESQEELASLVLRTLRKENKNYTLTPTRVKRIALKIPEVEVKAKTKRAVKMQKIDKCPICESKIEPLKVKNLLNKRIIAGYRCTSCGYESDLEAFMPMRYAFVWKQR